jgi:L-ascorbate metabolism protein UlaG (beta-lactamase superfamily)
MALPAGTTITWFGHSCFEMTTPGGKTVILDPFYENPNSPRSHDAVDRCDVLLVTHGHFDHFGSALAIASRLQPAWPCIHELSLWLARQLPGGADQVIGMNKGGTVEVAGLGVTMTTADHSAGDWNAGGETTLYLGDPVGFVIAVEDGSRWYFAGDTRAFSDMTLIRDLYRPDVAFLPIGGHYTMGPDEAALAVEFLGVQDVIPMHYGTFPILTGTPDALRSAIVARGLEGVTVHAPHPGGSIGG